MEYYFAPLEGITGYIYRNAFHDFYGGGINKYFTPFIAASQSGDFKSREMQDVLPQNNHNIRIIPQILSNKAEYFIKYAKALKQLSYEEVNLNLGCPYSTVVSKGKGSGFLADIVKLEAFLEEIFAADIIKISIKTRIGIKDPKEFEALLTLFNRFPLEELIIHPRVREDFYRNKPDWEAFLLAAQLSKNAICYNGDIFTCGDYDRLLGRFPEVNKIMLGRGLIANPGLLQNITQGIVTAKNNLKEFHDRVYSDYRQILSPDKIVLFKMKELWSYMQFMFIDCDKYIKKIRKAQTALEYEAAVSSLFRDRDIKEASGFAGDNR